MVGNRKELVVGPQQRGVMAKTHVQIIGPKIDLVLLAGLVVHKPGREGVMDGGTDPGASVAPDGSPAAVDDRDLRLETLDDPAMKNGKMNRRKLLSLFRPREPRGLRQRGRDGLHRGSGEETHCPSCGRNRRSLLCVSVAIVWHDSTAVPPVDALNGAVFGLDIK
jgi:hypothetical protein